MNRTIILLVLLTVVISIFSIAGIPAMIENYQTFDVGR